MNPDERAVIEQMERFGGSFIRALAAAYRLGDPDNRERIRNNWPEEWAKYRMFAEKKEAA
jgi:hypothetical protein